MDFSEWNAPTRMFECLFAEEEFQRKNTGPTNRTEIAVGKITLGGRMIPVLESNLLTQLMDQPLTIGSIYIPHGTNGLK